MICAMCGIQDSEGWIIVSVPVDITSGAICSTNCLVEYAARVFATEMEEGELK